MDGAVEFEYDNITIILGRCFSPHLLLNIYNSILSVILFDLLSTSSFNFRDFPGEHDISDESEAKTFITKAKYLETGIHRRFFFRRGRGTLKYDVAILELENPVDFTDPRLQHIRCYSMSYLI